MQCNVRKGKAFRHCLNLLTDKLIRMVAKKTFYHFFLTSVLRTVGMTECHCSSVV